MQNSEDDPSFSGELGKYAAETYKLSRLTKIVINHGMYKRFEKEKPLLFNVGIDYASFYYGGKKNNTMLFPLRYSKSKGAEYMLDAATNLHEKLPGWRFVAFGDFKGKVPKFIDFHYRVDTKKLKELYNGSKIFMLPSLVEGFSLPVLEAMASGCAVISTNCGGIDEYMVNNKNGLIVPIKNSRALEEAALKLVNNEELLKTLADNGQITAKKYSYENMYGQFINLFK